MLRSKHPEWEVRLLEDVFGGEMPGPVVTTEVPEAGAADTIHEVLATLTPREQQLIRLRYVQRMTLEQCGKILLNETTGLPGIHREGARKLEARALRKLKHPSRGRALKELTDAWHFLAEEPERWIFTFGFAHEHPVTHESLAQCYLVIEAPEEVARDRVWKVFGAQWSMQYPSEEAAGVERFNLRRIELPELPPTPTEEEEEGFNVS